jgi:hypothetical protein
MLKSHRSRLTAIVATGALSLAGAAPATAAPTMQDGLVNVAVTDNVIQAPIGIAANICGVSANVLANATYTAPVECQGATEATATSRGNNNGGPTRQRGLVNLAVTDNVVQIPVSAAANVCGVSVNALSSFIGTDEVACTARSRSGAKA